MGQRRQPEGWRDRVSTVVVGRDSDILSGQGDFARKVVAHSTMKLIQVLPVLILHLEERYHLSRAQIAVMCSSHLAQPQHLEVLESLLRRTDIAEEDMILPPSAPSGHIAYLRWKQSHLPLRKIYHPCSGNHIGMMLAHRELTGTVHGYERRESELQRWICRLVSQYSEYPERSITIVTDGCGVPSFFLPMYSVATSFKNIVCPPAGASGHTARLCACLQENPLMLEGDGCLSTAISSCDGLVAKTGAGGLLAVGMKECGCGALIRSATGNWVQVAEAALALLEQNGISYFV